MNREKVRVRRSRLINGPQPAASRLVQSERVSAIPQKGDDLVPARPESLKLPLPGFQLPDGRVGSDQMLLCTTKGGRFRTLQIKLGHHLRSTAVQTLVQSNGLNVGGLQGRFRGGHHSIANIQSLSEPDTASDVCESHLVN